MSTARTTRLLYLVNDAGFFLSHRLALARAAQAAGYEVAVAGPDGPARESIEAEGFAFYPISLVRGSLNPLQEVRSLLSVLRAYRRAAPRLVHQITFKPIVYGTWAARRARVPARVNSVTGLGYAFIPGGGRSILRALALLGYRYALRGAMQLIVQNPDDAQLLVRHTGASRERIAVILGSGVDVTRFSPMPEPEGVPTVLFASRLLWDKGLGELMEASYLLRARGLSFRVLLAGRSDSQNPGGVSQAQLDTWQREGLAEWLGHQEDMPGLLARSHVVCLPSFYREGVPRVLVEAAACGRPIVTTDTPGCREIVHHEDNGLLVPPRDARALATALERLLCGPDLRERMGRRGRARAEGEFSLQEVNRRTLAVYERALSEAPGG